MATPEFQSQQPDPRGISIPRLIAAEFGTTEMAVRQQLNHANAVVEINDVPWLGSKFFIPRDRLAGKMINVIGPERQWRMKYPDNQ